MRHVGQPPSYALTRPLSLAPYRAKLLTVFHEHGCLKFLHVVPKQPHNVFNPRFWLSISDEAGPVVDVGFDSMLPYAKTFGIPRCRLYRFNSLKSYTGKHKRSFFTRVDMTDTQDPLTTPEGKALLKQVQNDPLTKDAASFVQENSVRFYLAGLLDNPKKPLTSSQKRAERRMLERRSQSFSGPNINR